MQDVIKREVVKAGDCEQCVFDKLVRAPRKEVEYKDKIAAKPLERVFTNVVGSMKHRSIGRSKYFVTLLDAGSEYSIVRSIHRNSEVGDAVVEMIQESKTLFNSKICHMTTINKNVVEWIRSDGGGEYIGTNFSNRLKRRGIVHEVTTSYSPESNSNSEKLNRTLLYMARTMPIVLEKSGNDLCAEAVNAACYIKNRLVTRSCKQSRTSYEINHGRRPNLEHV